MAIDADLNAGVLTIEEATLRRQEISSEADFMVRWMVLQNL